MAKKVNPGFEKWRKHLKEVSKKNPKKSLTECMKIAKKSYKK